MARRHALVLLGAALCLPPSGALASECSRTSTGLVALTDLGPGLYLGREGGLYPGGSSQRPAAHEAAGLAIARSLVPLDTLGNPDPVDGRIVLISIGMSNTTQEFSAFIPRALNDPQRNPRLVVIDCARGGVAAEDMDHSADAYWDTVATRLRGRGSSPLQAQAVWIKQANRRPTGPFPDQAEFLMRNLGAIVRIIKDELPNVRLAYLSSRIYAGYASTTLNPEPHAYESGFSVKWLIEAQAAGEDSLNHDPEAGPVEAPWLSWGPYLWADGLSARGDGMIWRCEDFSSDGTHPSASGRNRVADSLLAFFKRDATTAPWFLSATLAAAPPARADSPRLAVAPNPARGAARIAFRPPAGVPWRLEILDLTGRRVRELASGAGRGEDLARAWDGRDADGARARAGVYWVRLAAGGASAARRLVLLDPD